MAVQCLNELITNALHHVPDVLKYLSRLKNQTVFNFCAIPQVSYVFKWFFIICSPADEKLEVKDVVMYHVGISLFYSPSLLSLPFFLVPALSAVGEVGAPLQSVLASISVELRLLP